MHLFIDIPNVTYRAGSTISGTVHLRGDDDITVEAIAINLIGRAKTKVTKRKQHQTAIYRGRAPLVSDSRRLFRGPHTLHPGHSWPFEFTIPLYRTARGEDAFHPSNALASPSLLSTNNLPFNYDAHQPLPPPISDSEYFFMTGTECECFVRYELEAKLTIHRRTLGPKDIDTTKPLDFITTRSVPNPPFNFTSLTRPLACSSLALDPAHAANPPSFKTKLKSSFRPSTLPRACFTLALRFPQVIIQDAPLPLSLSIDHDLPASASASPFPPPAVALRKCTVHLLAQTTIQCLRDDLFVHTGELQSWTQPHLIDSCEFPPPPPAKKNPGARTRPPSSSSPFLSASTTDLGPLMAHLKAPGAGQLPPSFATFNIRRGYTFLVKVTVECAGQGLKAEFVTGRVEVLPGGVSAASAAGAAAAAGGAAVAAAAGGEEGGEGEGGGQGAAVVLREGESLDVAPAYDGPAGVQHERGSLPPPAYQYQDQDVKGGG